ncbi:hypothetical protein BP6252_05092 [Coleophoma cylindrospora]|uniref:Uncharacterized protein n=1 Tax=Coleophoma cylindrospora TaxID=1849047 RepID=A0A3D8RSL7_9HELO|nr:hypothetical protein BP6252_05092 [Coleophoma cylindrospora]
MEADIRIRSDVNLGGHDQGAVDGGDAPVEDRDEDLERRGAQGEDVLDAEQRRREGQVGEQRADKGQRRDAEPQDGQVLEVPAVGGVDERGEVGEVLEGQAEGDEAEGVDEGRSAARGRREALQWVARGEGLGFHDGSLGFWRELVLGCWKKRGRE